MFPRMNAAGVMDAQTGLAVVATQLGFIRAAKEDGLAPQSQPKRRRVHVKSNNKHVLLGRALAQYEVVSDLAPTLQILKKYEALAQEHLTGVVWPTEAEHIPSFANSLRGYAKEVRSVSIPGPLPGTKLGLPGGRTEQNTYLLHHFLRAMLLIVEKGMPHAFDGFPMSTIAEWVPDKNQHCRSLDLMSGEEVRRQLGYSPLMVHCWTCMCGGVVGSLKGKNPELLDDASKLLISTPESQIWQTQATYERRSTTQDYSNYCFPPGPAAIYEDIMSASTG